ncbi:MAG: hypothetical protein AAF587_14270 [Bacteroidota bacterium]
MSDRKFYQLLNSFHPKELEQFEGFLRYVQTGNPTNEFRLFRTIEPHLPDSLEAEEIWHNMKEKEALNNTKLTRYFHNLKRKMESFWVLFDREWEEWEWKFELLKRYKKRGFLKIAQKKIKQLSARLDSMVALDEDQLHIRYLLACESHAVSYRLSPIHAESNIPAINQAFDAYWMLQKFKLACATISHNQTAGTQVPILGMDAVVATYDSMEPPPKGLTKMYRHLYALLSQEKILFPADFQEMLEPLKPDLSNSTYREIFNVLLNHYIKQQNQQQPSKETIQALIEMYLWGKEEHLLDINGYFIPKHYKNFLSLWLKLDKVDRATFFLEDWRKNLPPTLREDYFSFCKAMICFAKGEYKGLEEQVSLYKFQDVHLNIQSKFLLFQIQFEENYPEIDWFLKPEKTIRNIKEKLNRTELDSSHSIPYVKFCQYASKLVKHTQAKQLQATLEQLNGEQSIDNIFWLKEKFHHRLRHEFDISADAS